MKKRISVAFISKKLKNEFESLKDSKVEDKQLYKFILRAIDDLRDKDTKEIMAKTLYSKIWN